MHVRFGDAQGGVLGWLWWLRFVVWFLCRCGVIFGVGRVGASVLHMNRGLASGTSSLSWSVLVCVHVVPLLLICKAAVCLSL